MKREIITIDEDLCNGCGDCISDCSEGALQIVNGKAKLVREDFCDGFGDCIGVCPTGALKITVKNVKDFDQNAVEDHLRKTQGEEAVKKMEQAQDKHRNINQATIIKPIASHSGGGCPGKMNISLKKKDSSSPIPVQDGGGFMTSVIPSELQQWPVQLHLINPKADFLNGKELVILSTCSPVASADINWKYVRGRSVVVACPKLDNTGPYAEKLAQIFNSNEIPKVIILRMEVPCCGGLTQIVKESLKSVDGKDMLVEEHILGLDGSVREINKL